MLLQIKDHELKNCTAVALLAFELGSLENKRKVFLK